MQLTITAAAARQILAERHITVDTLKAKGRVDLSQFVYITFLGRSKYTLVDLGNATGEGIADMVPVHDRHLLGAWATDADGSTRAHRQADASEAARNDAVRRALQLT